MEAINFRSNSRYNGNEDLCDGILMGLFNYRLREPPPHLHNTHAIIQLHQRQKTGVEIESGMVRKRALVVE